MTDSQLSPERRSELERLQELVGYRFQDLKYLECALTHRSFANEADGSLGDYEALEFLGDSILGFLISEFLFRAFPDVSEGSLSKLKSRLVSSRELSRISRSLDLGSFLNLSRGEEKTGGREKKALLADLFESLTAAIYLDGGIEPARQFVLEQFENQLQEVFRGELESDDYKSALQERLHALGLPSPHYVVVEESGPDHEKEFVVTAVSRERTLGRGKGRSKRIAEREAARDALANLDADRVNPVPQESSS